jgi:hypothetical protein
MSKMPCSSCGTPNEEGARFCTRCGQSQEARLYCPSCNQPQVMGNRFCMSCGAAMSGARFQAEESAGAVVGGVWERAAGELIRRVDPEDCRSFLGARVVRVPPGTAGVVMIDGLVERVLPPGEQTTLNLFERISTFFTMRSDRTAFYLVDQRPVPVPFTVETRPGSEGRTAQTQVVVSFSLQRGDKEGLASFIANVLGPRASFSARDLFDLLRPEVRTSAALVLERLAAEGAFTYEAAEAAIRRELVDKLARYGLTLSVSVAPLTSIRSLNFHLGTGEAPELRPCVSCKAELPAAMKFCDRCGTSQPAWVSAARRCAGCKAAVPAGDAFCSACGKTFVAKPASASPLFSADGARVELDLVVRVSGQHQDFAPERIEGALVGAIAAHLRAVSFAALSTDAGFRGAEQAVRTSLEQALASFGLFLVSVAVVDVRDQRGQWVLGARADLTRAKDELLLGREWLAQRSEEVDLLELTLAQQLELQRVSREAKLAALGAELAGARRQAALEEEHAFARAEAELADRSRREALGSAAAELDAAGAERDAARDLRVGAAKQAVARGARERSREDELREQQHGITKETTAAEHRAALARSALALEVEKRRQVAELDAELARRAAEDAAQATERRKGIDFADHERRKRLDDELEANEQARQLAKLEGMAAIERRMVELEHAQQKELRASLVGLTEREMIAAQAAELAKSEGSGAAWAAALAGDEAKRVSDEHAAKLEAVMREQLDRMEALAKTAMATAARREGGTDQVYERSMDAMSRVAASRAAPPPAAQVITTAAPSVACKNPSCTALFPAGTAFCGSCGTAQ